MCKGCRHCCKLTCSVPEQKCGCNYCKDTLKTCVGCPLCCKFSRFNLQENVKASDSNVSSLPGEESDTDDMICWCKNCNLCHGCECCCKRVDRETPCSGCFYCKYVEVIHPEKLEYDSDVWWDKNK